MRTRSLRPSVAAGCSTLPTYWIEIRPRTSLWMRPRVRNRAAITILRDSKFRRGAIKLRILIDGALAAENQRRRESRLLRLTGRTHPRSEAPKSAARYARDADTLQANASAQYFYRINTDRAIKLLRTTEESATMNALRL